MVFDQKGVSLVQRLEGKVGRRRPFSEPGGDDAEKGVAAGWPQRGSQPVTMPIGRLFRQALIDGRWADDRQPGVIGDWKLAPGQAFVEWPDHPDDVLVARHQLDVLRPLGRIVDSLADVVVGCQLERDASIAVGIAAYGCGLLDRHCDRIFDGQSVRSIVPAEGQVRRDLDRAHVARRAVDHSRASAEADP